MDVVVEVEELLAGEVGVEQAEVELLLGFALRSSADVEV